MDNQQLMTISQFAKAVGTTRRTLIFYDQKGIFKPQKTEDNGYRYYSYEQIYKMNFILGLRDLGLSRTTSRTTSTTAARRCSTASWAN